MNVLVVGLLVQSGATVAILRTNTCLDGATVAATVTPSIVHLHITIYENVSYCIIIVEHVHTLWINQVSTLIIQ